VAGVVLRVVGRGGRAAAAVRDVAGGTLVGDLVVGLALHAGSWRGRKGAWTMRVAVESLAGPSAVTPV
jgi:hypothetical protein